MSQPSNRQALYDRIRKSSKEEVIIEEMIRLGFWPASSGKPNDPAAEIKRIGELERKLRSLRTENTRLHNIEALKREARKRRMAESRQRQKETKERRLRERAERAEAWKQRKTGDIVYLGDGVSGGLSSTEGNAERLKQSGLPSLGTAAEISRAMGVTVGELRFLAFSRATSRTTHYARFKIPKRTGGERLISAPRPRLKAAQHWILRNVLDKLEPHPAAHGFRPGRSIVSNARPHVGAEVVVNVDLKDFFPTVSYRRVKGLFSHLGYSDAAATIFGLICTEPDTVEADLDGVTYYVTVGERALPQGAPTSPAITNLICRRLDRRLAGACEKLGFTYTRYADDLSFSGSGLARERVGRLLRQVSWIVSREGFVVHPDKTRIFRRGRRQEVTGIVVNERVGVPRQILRKFRATLYQIEKDGPDGKRWGQSDDVIASIVGFANYVAMVDPDKGAELQRRAKALQARHGRKPTPPPKKSKKPKPEAQDDAAQAEAPVQDAGASDASASDESSTGKKKKKWWKIF